ncbi:hypothetical protein T265_01066 [Opisthorchis viverrini]|uniref:Uncharacterized protein n=1 Tax=Opisthorchis viverrini TaxID=6198 RepID=A0A075AJ92_OPIVI|nr:hypothetical protein T265_01066 [Opisthorchis viverrini]KER32979.1 hypothetical protein T265_01066 [Opisthorchis viverrini]
MISGTVFKSVLRIPDGTTRLPSPKILKPSHTFLSLWIPGTTVINGRIGKRLSTDTVNIELTLASQVVQNHPNAVADLVCLLCSETQRVFLNFPAYSLTVAQIQATATKQLHNFRNRSHFSGAAKRIYAKTYYSHVSSISSITVTHLLPLKILRMPSIFIHLRQIGFGSASTRLLLLRGQACGRPKPKFLINRKARMSTVHQHKRGLACG